MNIFTSGINFLHWPHCVAQNYSYWVHIVYKILNFRQMHYLKPVLDPLTYHHLMRWYFSSYIPRSRNFLVLTFCSSISDSISISVSVFVSLCLYISLCLCLCFCLCLPVCLSVSLSFSLILSLSLTHTFSLFLLSVCPSVFLSLCSFCWILCAI